MNTIDHWVRTVQTEPYEEFGKWWVKVTAYCGYWPHDEEHTLMCNSKEEALTIKEGHQFLA